MFVTQWSCLLLSGLVSKSIIILHTKENSEKIYSIAKPQASKLVCIIISSKVFWESVASNKMFCSYFTAESYPFG